MFKLNSCAKQKGERSETKALLERPDSIKSLESKFFDPGSKEYKELILELLGNFPAPYVRVLLADRNLKLSIYKAWPNGNNYCQAYFPGGEVGVRDTFACWTTTERNNTKNIKIPPGLVFGPGILVAGEKKEVTTAEAIRHGFIRNLLIYQFSKILNANTDAAQPAKEAQSAKAAEAALRQAKKDLITLATAIEADVRKDKPGTKFPFDDKEMVPEPTKQLSLLADFADSLYCSDATLKTLNDNFKKTSKLILDPNLIKNSH